MAMELKPTRLQLRFRYELAQIVVRQIERNLRSGTKHYRTKDGRLLRTQDEVVNAILCDDLRGV